MGLEFSARTLRLATWLWATCTTVVWTRCGEDEPASGGCVDNSCNLRCIHEEDRAGGYCQDGVCRCAPAEDAGLDGQDAAVDGDAGPGDAAGLGDVGPATEVCGPDYEVPSFHPSPGVATVVTHTFGLDAEAEIELLGPSHLTQSPGVGCLFAAEPGHYGVQVHDGDTEVMSLEVDLPEGETSLLALYYNDSEPGARVVPLDLSPPPQDQWRFVFVHVAQDNLETPLDVYVYAPGLWQPEGTPERVVEDLAFGDTAVLALPAHTLVYEFHPAGVPADGLNYTRLSDCGAPAFVVVAVVFCDTAGLGDSSACSNTIGPSFSAFSVEDEPCGM
jgi:hypothetical protein